MYRSDPRQPGDRVKPLGSIINDAAIARVAERGFESPRKPITAAGYGRKCESDTEKLLRRQGWTVTRSHLSRGAADIVAVDTSGRTRMIQVKSVQVFRPTAFNRGLVEILRAPPVHERCVYGWVYLHGLAVIITINAANSIFVTGKQQYITPVKKAIQAWQHRHVRAT